MRSIKAWFLRWLGAVPFSAITALHYEYRAALKALKDEQEAAKAEHEADVTKLIQELNALRNSIPATAVHDARPAVRVFRNFREFRSVVESVKPIRIERTS